ncbi:MAG: hypothetical protein IAE79_11600 [Anaerolinea sp.]|nr:hypothetical protein [Anaerolinea sp.]
MSQLLTLLNRLKVEARAEWLTDNQQVAWHHIRQQVRFPERINLYGVSGSGKTFLAWALANEQNAAFFASPNALFQSDFVNEPPRLMIVDNGVSETGELRRLLAELQMRNGRSALLITRQPNQLGLPLIHLPLPTSQDIIVTYHNLSLLEHYALTPLAEGNLWQVIHSTLS